MATTTMRCNGGGNKSDAAAQIVASKLSKCQRFLAHHVANCIAVAPFAFLLRSGNFIIALTAT